LTTPAAYSGVYEVTDTDPNFVHMGWLSMATAVLDLDLLYWNGSIWTVVMVASGEYTSFESVIHG
jgi:hypothetical protein